MAAYRGELEVEVTSAEALDRTAMQRVDKALKATQMAQGKTLKIVNRVSGQKRRGRCSH
jgi:F-type H+-transporting ATPase subunit O